MPRTGGRGLESEEKPASTLLAGFCGCDRHRMEGPSPSKVLVRSSDGLVIPCLLDCASPCPSLGYSWLRQLRYRDPVAQINSVYLSRVFLCLKHAADLTQNALKLAESRLRWAGEARGHAVSPICVLALQGWWNPFPRLPGPAALHRPSSPTGSSLVQSKYEFGWFD